ncbi:TetR/AcrR family transcriptional regulator [Paenibacillus sp. H1-7]|uniref:TetR/AcrR family transcriptional regulator n=1 Tax=Paenibacillus sp. H1-7 TaxID=2282849 RepID=UPI001EF8BAB2|nr:TetR/AcrR family transcriptional regulator [Paenibacillus sp. H1-7]ULL13521.1 TetR/AcrR family transcriptional regulator [Paenibacillus sp. H1-7]
MSEETYGRIVDTAYKLIAEHGLDHTSMSMIAREVGISKPAIYYYFTSKDVLIDVLFEELCKEMGFAKSFAVSDYTEHNFRDKLLEDGFHMIKEHQENPHFSRVVNEFLTLCLRNDTYRERIQAITKGFVTGFQDLLQQGVELGVVSGERIAAKAQLLTVVIDNIGNFMVMGYDFGSDYEQIWAEAVHNALNR